MVRKSGFSCLFDFKIKLNGWKYSVFTDNRKLEIKLIKNKSSERAEEICEVNPDNP